MTKKADEVRGEIENLLQNFRIDEGYAWRGEAYVPCWDDTLTINIIVDEDEDEVATVAQLAMLQFLLAHREDMRPAFLQKALRYYRAQVYRQFVAYGEDEDDISEQLAPRVTAAEQMWPLLEKPTLKLPAQARRKKPLFALLFECRWDREHGFAARVENGKIARVGQQGSIFKR